METIKAELTKKESLKLIRTPYFRIKEVLECVHNGRYHANYYSLIQQEEKDHRRFKPEGVICGLTQGEAVKLFYVQTILEYLQGNRILSAKEFLWVRKSHFFACSLAENYKPELTKALEGIDLQLVLSVDYAKLMQ